jgi:hypothetical protein
MVAEENHNHIEIPIKPEYHKIQSKELITEKPYLTLNSSENTKTIIEDSIINSDHKIRTLFKSQINSENILKHTERPHKTNCKNRF